MEAANGPKDQPLRGDETLPAAVCSLCTTAILLGVCYAAFYALVTTAYPELPLGVALLHLGLGFVMAGTVCVCARFYPAEFRRMYHSTMGRTITPE